jgi:hypothetical protein
MDFGPKEPPGLAYPFSQGIGGDDPVSRHLLNCSVMNAEHPRYLYVIYEVLDRHRRAGGTSFSSNHNFCLLMNHAF